MDGGSASKTDRGLPGIQQGFVQTAGAILDASRPDSVSIDSKKQPPQSKTNLFFTEQQCTNGAHAAQQHSSQFDIFVLLTSHCILYVVAWIYKY
jgi:hypothetical protein